MTKVDLKTAFVGRGQTSGWWLLRVKWGLPVAVRVFAGTWGRWRLPFARWVIVVSLRLAVAFNEKVSTSLFLLGGGDGDGGGGGGCGDGGGDYCILKP